MVGSSSSLFTGNSRYEVIRQIGAGGAGSVFEGYDREKKTRIAIKLLSRADQLPRFRREFFDHQHLQHPNLCSLGDFYFEKEHVFFTMELIDGTDFITYVRGASQSLLGFDEERLWSSLRQLASGLCALHQAGKVHRDIKPSNVLITKEGRVVIMDFGISTEVIGGRQLGDYADIGTPAYMSPEQGIGDNVGTATDWYSVGVMMYQALTGTLPYSGNSQKMKTEKLFQEAAPPRSIVAGIPQNLDLLCADFLRIDPKTRLRDTKALKRLGIDSPTRHSNIPGASTAQFNQETLFVGRQKELAKLDQAYASSQTQKRVSVVIKAPPGLGKTMLARKFLKKLESETPSPIVLASRCYQSVSVPFQTVAKLVEGLSRHLPTVFAAEKELLEPADAVALRLLFPRLTPVFARWGTKSEWTTQNPQAARSRAFDAFAKLLRAVVKERPVVLFVDDFQWIDVDSLALLRTSFDQSIMPSVLFIATIRTENYHSALFDGFAGYQELTLGTLPPDDAHDLVEGLYRLYCVPWDGKSERYITEANGHPMFLSELVRYGITFPKGSSSASLEEVILARIQKLDDVQRVILELLAVAGRPVDEELLMDAANLQLRECVSALASLHLNNLVRSAGSDRADQIELYHDRVRETVLANMPPQVLTEHHNTLANVLVGRLGHASDLVHHLKNAGHRQSAAEQAEIAAKGARQALAFDQMVKFLQIALELGEHSKEKRWQLHMELGDALCNAGQTVKASAIYLAAADSADPVGRLKSYHRAITQLILAGHLEAGVDQIRKVLAEVKEQELPSTPQGAVTSLLWRRLRLKMRGLRWKQRSTNDISPQELVRLDALKGIAMGISLCDNTLGAEFNTRFLLAALETGDAERVEVALAMEAIFIAASGGKATQRASALAQKVQCITDQYPEHHYGATWALAAKAFVAYFQGRFDEACPLFEEVHVRFWQDKTSSPIDLNNTRAFQLYCLRYLGRFRILRMILYDSLRDARERGDQYLITMLSRFVGRFNWLICDEPDLALSDLDQKRWATPPGAYHLQNWYELEARGEIALYKGDDSVAFENWQEDFEKLSRSLLLRVQPVRVLSRSLKARLLLAAGSISPQDNHHLEEATLIARQLAKENVGYSQVHAHLILASISFQKSKSNCEKTINHLRNALAHAQKDKLLLHTSITRRILGQLIGGYEGGTLWAESDTYMVSEGIQNPERMMAMIVPGFTQL